jgi:hypothetical protein
VLGEFGGLGFGVTNHTWSQRAWGYQGVDDSGRLTRQYCALLDKVWDLQRSNSLAAAVYTQLTDVETECNGFLTYDREVLKVDVPQVRSANLRQNPMLLPDARQGTFTWSFTTNAPPSNWMLPAFSPSDWSSGIGGFGTRQGPAVVVNTIWETADIWLRREFTLADGAPFPTALSIYHDEDAEVYLNGVMAGRFSGFLVGYKESALSAEARRALQVGRNVMAIHCHQTTGGQYIDAGLSAEAPAP